MTKIKNFRLTLRPREVARLLKNQHGVQITPELEASIEHTLSDVKRFLQPVALYTTVTQSVAEKTAPLPLPVGGVALSVVAATIGPQLEEERHSVVEKDALQGALLSAIQQEAVTQATQFALRLIQEQAKGEECEMSAPAPLAEGSLLVPLAALLGLQRIGVVLDPAAPHMPPYARLIWTAWTPVRKSGSKRSDSSSRPEKAAV
ncbi:MAG: hypothetical protein WC859_06770 [Elusimicrobiota bacterium]